MCDRIWRFLSEWIYRSLFSIFWNLDWPCESTVLEIFTKKYTRCDCCHHRLLLGSTDITLSRMIFLDIMYLSSFIANSYFYKLYELYAPIVMMYKPDLSHFINNLNVKWDHKIIKARPSNYIEKIDVMIIINVTWHLFKQSIWKIKKAIKLN